jgi:very-short-patch-repair endonuclease
MPKPGIITSQRINPNRLQRAKEMQQLKAGRLDGYHFRRQQIIGGCIVDFYCHQADLVIEVDGLSHLGQETYDAEREEVLAGWGIKVIRFTNDQVINHLADVLNNIRNHLSPSV